jgi:hypothetical protein
MVKKFKQGIYYPINKEKYLGTDNPRYLSSWELKLFSFCDNSPNIVKWCSEKVIIPYLDTVTNKNRNYFVDMLFSMRTDKGIINYLVEVKPFRETQPPKRSKRKKPSTLLYEELTWRKNQDKWNAAKKFADERNLKFIILTENELGSFENQ